jgi:hypothetical protein
MRKIYLLLAFLLIYISSFGQILTINEIQKGKTYVINGTTTGNEAVASEVDDNTVRLFNRTTGSTNDYRSTSDFEDFVINGINPTDVSDAVERINQVTFLSSQQPPYYLDVIQGNVNNEFIINKFGRNGAVGTGLAHVSISGQYQTPISPQSLEILSTDSDDGPAGPGAREVIIEGLDGNFDIQLDTVTMNGTTPVAVPKQFIRIYRAFVSQSGSYVTTAIPSHVGQITVRNAGAGVTWFTIDTVEETATGFGIGQTQIGSYTVPRNHTAYLISKTFTVETNKPASIYFFKREMANDVTTPYDGIMRLFEQNDGIAIPFTIASQMPLDVIHGPAEVGFFAKVSSLPTASISVEFQLLVKKNN